MRRIEIGRVGRVGALVALMAVSAGPVHAQAPLGEPVNLDEMQRQLEADHKPREDG